MSSERREVYLLQDDTDDEWVRPTPASTAIVEAVTSHTSLAESDIDDLETYVDWTELANVLAGENGELVFAVEGHEVVVDSGGSITVED